MEQLNIANYSPTKQIEDGESSNTGRKSIYLNIT